MKIKQSNKEPISQPINQRTKKSINQLIAYSINKKSTIRRTNPSITKHQSNNPFQIKLQPNLTSISHPIIPKSKRQSIKSAKA